MRKLFGTDGIRAEANKYPLDGETVFAVGRSAAITLRGKRPKPLVVVGRDTRISGTMLCAAISSGLCAQGADVIDVGVVSTPAVAYITRSLDADAGVVISASHNPYQDNGIKFFGGDGFKLPDEVELEIERVMEETDFAAVRPDHGKIGTIKTNHALHEAYIDHLLGTVGEKIDLRDKTIVLDTANGAAHQLARVLFKRLNARIIPLGMEPNGTNINDGVGAVYPERMCHMVKETGASFGISLDGDADRLIMCDEYGDLVDGDMIMAMCAKYLYERDMLQGNTVIATVMSNLGLEKALSSIGVRLERVSVGDRYVVERMRQGDFNLGGEQSGHLIFMDKITTGDGLLSALMVMRVMGDEQRPLSELASFMKPFPQTLKNVLINRKPPIAELPGVMQEIRQVEQELGTDGRVLVRYSGTENKARVMIEGPDQITIEAMADRIVDQFKNALPLT